MFVKEAMCARNSIVSEIQQKESFTKEILYSYFNFIYNQKPVRI